MKAKASIFIPFLILLLSCGKNDYTTEAHLSVKEQDQVLMAIIRYMGKAPENVSEIEKFDPKHNTYYLDIASRHRFEQYFIDGDGVHFFLISRPAPSLYEKRVAIGGKMKFDKSWNLLEYEEVFRTWKMKEDELKLKGAMLFDLMVKGKDLTPYYRANSSEEYIEFPDDHNYFDRTTKSWKTR